MPQPDFSIDGKVIGVRVRKRPATVRFRTRTRIIKLMADERGTRREGRVSLLGCG